MSTIYLFDVDGTLVSTGGAGRRAMERAFEAFCGRGEVCREIELGGMTDWLIVRTALELAKQPHEPESVRTILELYLGFLRHELTATEGYVIYPGVVDVLRDLVERDDVALGLGTGNIERGARMKLAHGEIDHFFDFGGFGDDHENRTELLRAGAKRGAAVLKRPIGDCRIVVIGDTPRDIVAARELGAECIAVATGGHSAASLRELGAHEVYEDLSDTRALDRLLRAAD